MSAQPGDQHWFISLNGKRYGPYSFAALSEAAAKGVIDANTSVWRLGWVKWHPARRVPGLIEDTPPPEPIDQASDEESPEGVDRSSEAAHPSQWQNEDAGAELPHRSGRPGAEEQVAATRQRQRRVEDDVAEAQERRRSQAAEDDTAPAEPVRPRKAQATEVENVPAETPPRRKQADQDAANEVPRRRKSQATEDEDPPVGGALRARPPGEDDEGNSVAAPPTGDRWSNGAGRRTEEGAVPHVEARNPLALSPPHQAGGFAKSAAIGAVAVTVLAGVGLFYSGMIVMVEPGRTTASVEQAAPAAPPPAAPQPPSQVAPPERGAPSNLAADGSLPDVVAALPAVIALQRNDPAAFARFNKRFADIAANAPLDALPSLARAALRKSVKRRLASSSSDALLEITEVYLAYMQALQTLSPESCVALSDESKGANLTVNLAQQLPALFGREMALLERVASTDPAATFAPTADKAKSYLDKVFAQLVKQPVQTELLGRTTLLESEFTPYCTLVIAFYKTVLTLPSDDRVNLLRYLYTAAIDPEDEK